MNPQDALQLAKERWPGVALDEARFLEALARRGQASPHVADLYLASACLEGDQIALRHFDEHLGRECEAVGRRSRDVDPSELHSALRTRLLVEPGALSEYAGEGSLRGWLAAVVVRSSLNARRTRSREQSRGEAAMGPPDGSAALAHPELELLRARYRDDFTEAFKTALASLDAKDRALLRLNVVDGLGLDRLARLRNVGRSTAARWLASIREQLLEQTRAALQARIGVGENTVDSLLVLLRSELDLSLRTWLDQE